MSTSEECSSSNTKYFTWSNKIPGLRVNSMDIITSHHAVQFAHNWVVEGNSPLFMEFVTYHYGGLFFPSMSDPGTTYHTHEEIQQMHSTQSPTCRLQRYIKEWGLTPLQELRQLNKEAKAEVDQAIEEAKTSPACRSKGLWTDIYDKGPPFMRGRERKEVHHLPILSNGPNPMQLLSHEALNLHHLRQRTILMRCDFIASYLCKAG
ncbi:hypothetical protein PISMIDRAFT_10416 [Pisolithus microcarpus 441]|uniref:Dehydrogenase E1 component domain-containing protein n=1 Tax=Pisolithus microcarpus 441 TaxID=765257 RepID=A0A0C9ZDZ8_9AGAM|nr:hypothetical protein PISMIDRAFT_10416 [Pisolithus microcarpus 441]